MAGAMRRPRTNGLNIGRVRKPFNLKALLSMLLLAEMLAGCSADNHAVLHSAKGDYAFSIEIADTEADRAKGLMFRQSLAADAGMLFDYGHEQLASFWMQNTFIPLDMIFVSADGVVKTIKVNARPLASR